MNIEEEKVYSKKSMNLIRVNEGDVFHFAEFTFEEAMAGSAFYMLTDQSISDDNCTIVHLETGNLYVHKADMKVICYPAVIKIVNDPQEQR